MWHPNWCVWVNLSLICLQGLALSLASQDAIILNPTQEGQDQQIEEVVRNVEQQFDEFHASVTEKFSTLHRSCNGSLHGPVDTLTYRVQPKADSLIDTVAQMLGRYMLDSHSIFLEDLETAAHNITVQVSDTLQEKVTSFSNNIPLEDVGDTLDLLSKTNFTDDVRASLDQFKSSVTKELREVSNTLPGKILFESMMNEAESRMVQLQNKAYNLETCKKALDSKDLLTVKELAETTAEVKGWVSKTTVPHCPKVPGEMLSSLALAGEENQNTLDNMSKSLDDFKIKMEGQIEHIQQFVNERMTMVDE